MMKVLLATGGSGGHIYPALYVASELTRQGQEVHFAGAFGSLADQILAQGYRVDRISAVGFSKRSVSAVLFFFIKLFESFGQAFTILKKEKPDAVIGFGGYGSFPVVLMAALHGVPTMIHEQNVSPGKANGFLKFFVRKIAVSFRQSEKFFPAAKTVYTGCPCHLRQGNYDKTQIAKHFGLEPGRFTLLILGGSQGSRRINEEMMAALPLIKQSVDLQVLHIAGNHGLDELREFYDRQGIASFLTPFLEEIEWAYALADLAVSRAGAVTITELDLFEVPSVLIPYPFAGNHQKANAGVFQETRGAQILEEKNLSPEILASAVVSGYQRRRNEGERRTSGSSGALASAAERLAQEIMRIPK